MPSKSKRAASRQARLSQRKRRRGGRDRTDSDLPEGAAIQDSQSSRHSEARTASAVATVPAAPVAPRTAVSRPAVAAATPRSRIRGTRPRSQSGPLPMYGYLGSELKRIGVLTCMIAVVLAVLTVVLR